MAGITELSKLLAQMQPVIKPGEYIYATLPYSNVIPREHTIMEMIEDEGITVVVEAKIAQKYGLDTSLRFAWITLKVHSSLKAVGLTAAFSKALAEARISCNVVAGFYHDHILTPLDQADHAMEVLNEMVRQQAESKAGT